MNVMAPFIIPNEKIPFSWSIFINYPLSSNLKIISLEGFFYFIVNQIRQDGCLTIEQHTTYIAINCRGQHWGNNYKKRLVSRINPSLLQKIILYNTWTLQLNKFKLYTTDSEGTSLIKHGSWIESSSLHQFNLLNKLRLMCFELIKLW